ncbi:chordin isoform X9 [Physeter macrocephalus]|uniref:Chordin n=1 Tax=Physeter macrocephalus TaxID=9755 RepID=A0A9W2WLP2_PHYMC|nr:chordin isoform X9 [Physeter catodon]
MPSLPAPPAPLLLLGLLLLCSRPARGAGPEHPALPIRPEKEPLPIRGAAGCSFGGKVYALDETWHPDLGEPFGVMRCVLCACEAPQWGRRARGAGRVSCKNIKPECPTLACGQPRQLPGHCCQTCPQERSDPEKQPTGLAFEYPRDPEHRSYSDRGEPGAEDRGRGDGHTDFVALLTGPRSQAVARARVSLLRSSLRFSISYRRLDRPTRIRFSDSTGSILFEHPAAPTQDGLVCGVWRAVPRLSLRLLRAEQLHVALVTPSHPSGEVWGPLIRHRALAAETFSAILTLEGPPQQGIGGIALLTLSDTEDSLHFLLLFRGLLEARSGGPAQVPLRLQILHQGKLLRELQANASAQEPGFAEVLPNLTAQEMDWLVLGELQMALERASGPGLRISGHIAARQSCDVLQSVLCGADALIPVQTGAAGSASLTLLGNGSLIYQVQVVGTGSEVVAMTLETKPQRRNQHTVLCHMAGLQQGGYMAQGVVKDLEPELLRHLAQGSASLLITTKGSPQGELRGQVHIANQCEAGGLRLAAAGAEEVRVPGALDAVVAEAAALPAVLGPDAPAPAKPGGPGRLRDPNTCFFEGQQRPHGARWAPNYDPLCSLCTCQRRTVICDPMVCPPPSCPSPVQAPDQCCPVCPGECPAGAERVMEGPPCGREASAEGRRGPPSAFTASLAPQRSKMLETCRGCRRTGTLERGGTGEVHCEKVQCPRLACAQPVRANPTDCCKQCPVGSGAHPQLGDPMQADGPRGCRFAGQWFPESQSWHPSVPPFGEMSCITCRCGQLQTPGQLQSWRKKLKAPREQPEGRVTKRMGPGLGEEGRRGPRILLREIQCLWPLFSASSPSPTTSGNHNSTRGRGSQGRPMPCPLQLRPCHPLASALEAQPLSFCT